MEKNTIPGLLCVEFLTDEPHLFIFDDKQMRRKYSLDDSFMIQYLNRFCFHVNIVTDTDGKNYANNAVDFMGYLPIDDNIRTTRITK